MRKNNNDYNNLNQLYVESIGLGPNAEGEGLQRSIQMDIKSAESRPVFKGECENCTDSDDKCPECAQATSVKGILKVINNMVRKMYKEVADDEDPKKLARLKAIAHSIADLDSPESDDQLDGNVGNDVSENEPTEGGVP